MVASSALPPDGEMSGIATELEHRLVIDGIFFWTRTGCPWRDRPERFGNWS
jgi:transposase